MLSSKRIEWLDYMKGVAILIVVVGHITAHVGTNYLFGYLIVVCEMPLFFFLSGILANKTTNRTISENYKKKLLSLGIPLIVVGGIYNLIVGSFYIYMFDLYHMGFWFLLSLLTCWLIFVPLLKFIKFVFRDKNKILSGLGEILLFLPFFAYQTAKVYIPENIDDVL